METVMTIPFSNRNYTYHKKVLLTECLFFMNELEQCSLLQEDCCIYLLINKLK